MIQFNKTWWLYDMVYKMSNEDLSKMDSIWKLPFKGLLNHLSYTISKTNLKR